MKRHILGIFVLIFALSTAPVLAGDFVLLKGGKFLEPAPKSGSNPPLREDHEDDNAIHTVISEDYDKVVISLKIPGGRSSRQPMDTEKVDTIFYWPKPAVYVDGVNAMIEGRYDDAISKFDSLAENRQMRFWVRAYSIFSMAQIYEEQGNVRMAVDTWEQLVKEFPKFRQVPHALVQIGLGWMTLGDGNQARAAFGRLQRLPGLPEGKKGLALYYLIFIKQKQGEATKNDSLIRAALSEYESLLGKVENDPEQAEVALRARLGIGNCKVLLGQFDEAIAFFQKIADSSDEGAVLAGAFNGLGKCYFRQARYKDALKAFLRVEILYDVDAEQTAMALCYSGRCFRFMQGKGIGEDNGDRARGQYRKCFGRFPGSTWAADAKTEITQVKSDRPR